MKFVFLSNYLIHHQTEFCEEMYRITNGNFYFVATSRITQERINLGYEDFSKNAPSYYLDATEEANNERIIELIEQADAVIIGSAPWHYVEKRVKQGKLTYIYSERIFKNLIGSLKAILKGTVKNRFVLPGRKSNVRLLCASAYLPGEMRFLNTFSDRMYRWGYFSPFVKSDECRIKECIEILWCGRFVAFKRPKFIIKLAKYIKKNNINARISVIGTGAMEGMLRKQIERNRLQKHITLLGAMSPDKVREYMCKSDVFIFTSNKGEGWGAVQNEAMNSHCAVVSSSKIGSTPFLIRNGFNGLVYKDSSSRDFCKCVERLCKDKELMQSLQVNAYETILNEWNGKSGAQRLYQLTKDILNGGDTPYKTGPCSKITD